jgi:hypothetical protein
MGLPSSSDASVLKATAKLKAAVVEAGATDAAAESNPKLKAEAKAASEKQADASNALQKVLAQRQIDQDDVDQDNDLRSPWLHWPGMLVTFVALSLGGPFWFDALGTLVNVRMAGTKPANQSKKKPDNAAKDKVTA